MPRSHLRPRRLVRARARLLTTGHGILSLTATRFLASLITRRRILPGLRARSGSSAWLPDSPPASSTIRPIQVTRFLSLTTGQASADQRFGFVTTVRRNVTAGCLGSHYLCPQKLGYNRTPSRERPGGRTVSSRREFLISGAGTWPTAAFALSRPTDIHANPLGKPIGLELYTVGAELDNDYD